MYNCSAPQYLCLSLAWKPSRLVARSSALSLSLAERRRSVTPALIRGKEGEVLDYLLETVCSYYTWVYSLLVARMEGRKVVRFSDEGE